MTLTSQGIVVGHCQADSVYVFPSWPLGVGVVPQKESRHRLVSPVCASCIVETCSLPPFKKKKKKGKTNPRTVCQTRFSGENGVTRILKLSLACISVAGVLTVGD